MGKKVFIDRTGERFGRLIILYYTQKCNRSKGINDTKVLCLCDCGTEKEISISSLVQGFTNSCGCLNKEKAKQRFTKHSGTAKGSAVSRAYNSWRGMRERCNDPNNTHYKYYGGKGIKVCDEWEKSFLTFLNDMGGRPTGKTLDRINPHLGYYKENCRWVTDSMQAFNKNKESKGSSKRKGVSWHKRVKKWQARITIQHIGEIHLGYFADEQEAIQAREDAELLYRGENLK